MRAPRSTPTRFSTRPPEPIRPAPARVTAVSLLAVKARRRRYRILPPGAI
jgi:hypothetical protein